MSRARCLELTRQMLAQSVFTKAGTLLSPNGPAGVRVAPRSTEIIQESKSGKNQGWTGDDLIPPFNILGQGTREGPPDLPPNSEPMLLPNSPSGPTQPQALLQKFSLPIVPQPNPKSGKLPSYYAHSHSVPRHHLPIQSPTPDFNQPTTPFSARPTHSLT